MKKQLLLASALFGMFFSVKAQEVTEDFNSYTVGNLGTDITGVTAGQGGWNTQAGTAFANEDFQVVAGDAAHGNVLQVNGSAAATGSAFLWRSNMLDWEGRTAGNNAVAVTYDFYTGTADATASNAFGAAIYDETYAIQLNGFIYDQRTLTAIGFAYVMLDGDTEPSNQLITLPNLDSSAAATLPENTWVTVTMTFDSTTGQIGWSGVDADGNVLFSVVGAGSATGEAPFEADLLTINVYNDATATGGSSTTFDNLSVSLVGSTAGVKDNAIASLSVYPNPANSVVTISNNENVLLNGVVITDINGRTVKTAKFNGVAQAEVNISDLASGIYMMTVSSDKGATTKKIIKN